MSEQEQKDYWKKKTVDLIELFTEKKEAYLFDFMASKQKAYRYLEELYLIRKILQTRGKQVEIYS